MAVLPIPNPDALQDGDKWVSTSFYRFLSSLEREVRNILENTTGSTPLFFCRGWVSFDGTKDTTGAASTANTNRLIRGSGNVSSVLRTATGEYTVNFTIAMPDANYTFVGSSSNNDNNAAESFVVSRQASGAYTATQCAITNTENTTSSTVRGDSNIINVVFFR